MKKLNLAIILGLVCLTGCTPTIKNDHSIGEVESKTYKALTDRLTEEMKSQFNGNMYQNEKITPIETADGIKIGIPGVVTYTFRKDNSKYVKGDLNNDKKTDLVIWANMTEAQGYENKKYFIFLQGKDGYQYVGEFKADDLVSDNCRKDDLDRGIFNLDSISGGLLIGNTDYKGNHESSYLNFSYRCATEKYKFNLTTKDFKIAFRSDLLKKNDKTGMYEKVVK